ncbi:MAG TPA: DUF3499 domain-containing protein [Jiangellaceae bacterium]|nr:DUF3499 domain-containing protein [Jiangellaceae bacterium]
MKIVVLPRRARGPAGAFTTIFTSTGPVGLAARHRDGVHACWRAGTEADATRANVRFVSPARRRCSRSACGRPAVATLTYVYADSTAVLGPLATYAEPHCYDLCAEHSERLVAPRGWEVIRLAPDPASLGPSSDDLLALADAVREAARPQIAAPARVGEVGRRGHLRVLRNPDA